MAKEAIARLRDQRKPGHGWFDNEIYDVFGDELRQDGISVYMTLARLCWGTRVKMSLREMAGHARMSKDTFARNLKRVIDLGLVIEHKGSTPQSASTYDLVDVKELAAAHLRAAVQASRSVSAGDSFRSVTMAQMLKPDAAMNLEGGSAGGYIDCLTVRHEADDVEIFVPAADSATGVSQNCTVFATEVSQDVRHLRQDSRLKTKETTTPLPPPGGGAQCVDPVCNAVSVVMRSSNLTDEALRPVIEKALRCYAQERKADPAMVGALMADNYAEYVRAGPMLRYTWAPKKFFAQGHWINHQGWPIDQKLLLDARRRL